MRSLVCGLLFFAACSARTTAEQDALDDDTLDGASQDEHEEVDCGERMMFCDNQCVDPATSSEHCGVCNHECQDPYYHGFCEEGQCPSAHQCAGKEGGYKTCAEACASLGQVCDEGPRRSSRGCGGGYRLTFGRDALAVCERGLGGQGSFHATCNTPIDWTVLGGLSGDEPAGAVTCCCTQDP